jgi:PAS domain S-box-containing protein
MPRSVIPGHPFKTAASDGAAVTRRFPAVTASVGQARRFLIDALPPQCLVGADGVVLMLSELATNAVQHASTPFDVTLAVAPDGMSVRVAVSDGAGGYPAPQEPNAEAPCGRGLHIVCTLADTWGIEMRRDQPGKTVWFDGSLAARAEPLTHEGAALGGRTNVREAPSWTPRRSTAGAGAAAGAGGAGGAVRAGGTASANMAMAPTSWPTPSVRAVLDGLRDAVVATDADGEIHYVNAAAEELMGWPHGSLVGRSALDLVPDSLSAAFDAGFGHFIRSRGDELIGHKLSTVIRCADGSEVDTELVLSIFDHPQGGTVVVGIFRPRDDRKLQRWSELTSELLEILVNAPVEDAPAERLLATLGRQLDWDVTTLWALSANHELVCRHVWTRSPTIAPAFAQEKAADPTSGSTGLPRWVIEHGEPLWVPDLGSDWRFSTDALAQDGLRSAYAFPIRYGGACIGVVKMLSRHQRERDPSVVELMSAVGGHLGELLHASTLAAEREHLLDELLEARRRNEFLLLATQVLSEVAEYHEMVDRLAQVSVPVLADLCLIDIADENGQLRRMTAWHADPSKRSMTEELRTRYAPDPSSSHPTVVVMESGQSMWSAHMSDEFLRTTSRDDRHYSILKLLGFTSYMTVPLRLRNEQVLGTVTLVSAGSGRRFSEKDLGLAEQLAKQVSAVVIRARAFDRERRISHELQRNMLPDAIPDIDGWRVAARYLPAAVGFEVGGDWYDVVPLADGLVAFVVGDVEGHDLGAAKIMSRLRHTLGLLVLEERAPGPALERLNRVSLAGASERLATALVGVLDTASGQVTFSSAGHPSPVRVRRGQAIELPVPPGPPLGVQPCHYKDHEFDLADGCLVMFTDGLVERRSAHLDERLSLLESSLRTSPSNEPDRIADDVIDAMTADERRSDDIVVLTARRHG